MTESQKADFLNESLRELAVAEAGNPLNFVAACADYVERWRAAHGDSLINGESCYCVFVYCSSLAPFRESDGFVHSELFREDTPPSLLNHFYMCSESLSEVYAKSSSFSDLSDALRKLREISIPFEGVAIYNSANKELLWKAGESESFSKISLHGPGGISDVAGIESALIEFHINYTEAPSGYTIPWNNASKGVPMPKLEDRIRNDLLFFFRQRISNSENVSRESMTPSGRVDVLLRMPQMDSIFYFELKVIASWYWSNGRVRAVNAKLAPWWAKKGVTQAYLYKRSSKKSGFAYACVFDARDSNEDLPGILEYANSREVEFRRFFMFRSSEDLQEFTASQSLQ